MEVIYNDKLIKDSEFLKVSDTQIEPNIKLNVDYNKFYSLIMYDPDAVNGTHIHWIRVNITNNDIRTGNIIIPYKGPAPPANTGKHRYIFELYEQNGENNLEETEERNMSIISLRKKLQLKNPIYKIQFISQNEVGGRKRKRKTKIKLKNTKRSRKTRRN